MSAYDAMIKKRSKDIWEVMHDQAYKHHIARERHPVHGDGRTIINTVGAFIQALNKERDWELTQSDKDLIRRFLKASGNVVVLTKVEKFRFRIFIREEWNDSDLVTTIHHPQPPRTTSKLTPADLGEDREPGEVIYRCADCQDSFDSQQALDEHRQVHKEETVSDPTHECPDCGKQYTGPNADMALLGHRAAHSKKKRAKPKPRQTKVISTSELTPRSRIHGFTARQAKAIRALYEAGGEVNHPEGHASRVWADLYGEERLFISTAQKHFRDAKLIQREGKAKLSYRFALTQKGIKLAEKLPSSKDLPPKLEQHAPEETVSSGEVLASMLGDAELVSELESRLRSKGGGELQSKLELVASIVEEVMDGKTAPFKALADIQEAVKL